MAPVGLDMASLMAYSRAGSGKETAKAPDDGVAVGAVTAVGFLKFLHPLENNARAAITAKIGRMFFFMSELSVPREFYFLPDRVKHRLYTALKRYMKPEIIKQGISHKKPRNTRYYPR